MVKNIKSQLKNQTKVITGKVILYILHIYKLKRKIT